ncbi:MAG TPA: hypothetical protein VJO99_04140 [Burkholderiaceae bacterium]|nr:hypothetical protein [Burkholderiaceae bacterium]
MSFRPFALRTLLARGALALLLVLGQQHAALHWLTHAVDAVGSAATQKAAQHGSNDVCDECAGLTAFGAMAVGAQTMLALPLARHAVAATVPATAPQRAPRLAFHSRAPPVLS